MVSDCLFCKIIRKEIPATVAFEDDKTISFMELFPSAPGHVMVIHKKHGYSILDYSQNELGQLMATVQGVAKKVEKALKADSLTIGINHHEEKGVPHLHVHIIPRHKNDKGGIIQSIVTNKSDESKEVIAEKIRRA